MTTRKTIGFAVAGLAAGILTMTVLSTTQAQEADERAAATERTTPRCLDGRQVGRTHVLDQNTLLVYDRSGNPYKLDVSGPCRSMNDMSVFGFEFRGSTEICRAHDATLLRYDPPGSMAVRCLINGVEPLTRAQAAQLDPE